MNSDEALRCIDISKKKFARGDSAAAAKFAAKAVALADSPDARSWLEFVQNHISSTTASASASTSSSDAPGLRQRRSQSSAAPTSTQPAASSKSTSASSSRKRSSSKSPSRGSSKPNNPSASSTNSKKPGIDDDAPSRPFTPDQVAGIKRIRQFNAKSDLYGILGLEKACSESDIKKAYRKLALQYHPDKCGAPGTDDAFKAIGHAFTVLGDPDKRESYDRYGIDSESSGSAAARGGGPGFRGFNGTRFESEISPEDLFRMFMGGDEFPGFAFQAGPGFRTHVYNGANRRRRPGAAAPAQHNDDDTINGIPINPATIAQCIQLLPLIILVLFTTLSILSSLFTSSPFGFGVDPYSFTPTSTHRYRRESRPNGVTYYVNGDQYRKKFANDEAREQLDRAVENQYLEHLQHNCAREEETRRMRMAQAYGLFMVDTRMLKRAEAMRMPSCERIKTWVLARPKTSGDGGDGSYAQRGAFL